MYIYMYVCVCVFIYTIYIYTGYKVTMLMKQVQEECENLKGHCQQMQNECVCVCVMYNMCVLHELTILNP